MLDTSESKCDFLNGRDGLLYCGSSVAESRVPFAVSTRHLIEACVVCIMSCLYLVKGELPADRGLSLVTCALIFITKHGSINNLQYKEL